MFKASLVDANANLGSIKPLDTKTLKAIEQTAREQLQKLEQVDDDQSQPPSSGEGSAPSKPAEGKYFKTNRQFGSKTDPDAAKDAAKAFIAKNASFMILRPTPITA